MSSVRTLKRQSVRKQKAEAEKLAKGDKPVIDFGEVSFQDSVEMSLIEARLQRLTILQERVQAGDAPVEVFQEIVDASAPENMEMVFRQMRGLFALVVRYMPRDWFVKNLPEQMPYEDIDFSNPETYKYLRSDRTAQLRRAIQVAQQPESVAKNSEAAS